MSEESSEDHIKDSAGVERFSIDERFDFRLPETARGDDMPVTDSEGPIEPEPTLAGRVPDSTDEVDPLLGMTIGNYEIQRELGRGGFGTVYKALDIKLDRPAALKFLRFPLDRQHRELFVREAKVIANLSTHPSIVQIYAWGEFRGSYYFALEYLDMSAEKLLNTTPGAVPVAKALRIVSSCASGLQYAHDHGSCTGTSSRATFLSTARLSRRNCVTSVWPSFTRWVPARRCPPSRVRRPTWRRSKSAAAR